MPSDTSLGWDLFITPGMAVGANERAPNTTETFWQPTTSTLIFGKRDAVLVDVPATWQQAVTLQLWIKDSGKDLKTIFVTHGHGDHWFGASALLERYPNARVVATHGTLEIMRQQASPESLKIYNAIFSGQIPNKLAAPEELPKGNTIDLEGNDLNAVELGHTDGDSTTCLHVPSLGLVVAGDAVYNGPHQWLVESTIPQKRKEWITALDKIESLDARAIIAGHKRPGTGNDPRIIEETRQYIQDFDRITGTTSTPRQLYDGMLDLYSQRLNSYIL